MDIQATYRYRKARLGWVWVCYSHPAPIKRRHLFRHHGQRAEYHCRQGLSKHLKAEHAGELAES